MTQGKLASTLTIDRSPVAKRATGKSLSDLSPVKKYDCNKISANRQEKYGIWNINDPSCCGRRMHG